MPPTTELSTVPTINTLLTSGGGGGVEAVLSPYQIISRKGYPPPLAPYYCSYYLQLKFHPNVLQKDHFISICQHSFWVKVCTDIANSKTVPFYYTYNCGCLSTTLFCSYAEVYTGIPGFLETLLVSLPKRGVCKTYSRNFQTTFL